MDSRAGLSVEQAERKAGGKVQLWGQMWRTWQVMVITSVFNLRVMVFAMV